MLRLKPEHLLIAGVLLGSCDVGLKKHSASYADERRLPVPPALLMATQLPGDEKMNGMRVCAR